MTKQQTQLKKVYEKAEFDFLELLSTDTICTSVRGGDGGGDDDDPGDGLFDE